MSENKHTTEPWRIWRDTTGNPVLGSTSTPQVIATTLGGQCAADWPNFNRIAACVNACKGIAPESVPELFEALERLQEAAFPFLADDETMDMAHAVIAKARAKGEDHE